MVLIRPEKAAGALVLRHNAAALATADDFLAALWAGESGDVFGAGDIGLARHALYSVFVC